MRLLTGQCHRCPRGWRKRRNRYVLLLRVMYFGNNFIFFCQRRVPCFSAPVYTKWPPFLLQKRVKSVTTVRYGRGLLYWAQILEVFLCKYNLGGDYYAVFLPIDGLRSTKESRDHGESSHFVDYLRAPWRCSNAHWTKGGGNLCPPPSKQKSPINTSKTISAVLFHI